MKGVVDCLPPAGINEGTGTWAMAVVEAMGRLQATERAMLTMLRVELRRAFPDVSRLCMKNLL